MAARLAALPPWARRLAPAALALVYVAAWALSPLVTGRQQSDLDLYFWPSAEVAAHGHPLLVYSLHPADANPNANGPLGLLPLIPAALLVNTFGGADDLRAHAIVANAIAAVLTLLLAHEVLRAVREARGHRSWDVLVPATVLIGPPLLTAIGDFGHVEQPLEVWLVLLSARWIRAQRMGAAALAISLAVLTRTAALLDLIVLLPLVRFGRSVWRTASFAGIFAATVIAGLAPFVVADRADVVHSLITYRGARGVDGGTAWLLALHTPAASVAQYGDVLIVAGVAALACVAAYRRARAALTQAAVFGLLAMVGALFAALVKTAYAYYLFEPYVFACAWWLARPANPVGWRALVPLALSLDLLMMRGSLSQSGSAAGLAQGVLSTILLLAAALSILVDVIVAARRYPVRL